MRHFQFGSGNKKPLPVARQLTQDKPKARACHMSIGEVEKIKTGDTRVELEEFYGSELPITYIPKPQ